MSDRKTLDVYDAKAQTYAEMSAKFENNRDLASFINAVPDGGHILDLGCGPGHYAALMAKAGFKVSATDASGEMIKLAQTRPGVTAWQETFEEMHECGQYDGIFANFSLLHAKREAVPTHVANLTRMLNVGGIFHIALKSGTGEKRDPLGRRYSYFTENELAEMLTQNGLKVFHTNQGSDIGLDGVMADWVCLQARKEKDTHA